MPTYLYRKLFTETIDVGTRNLDVFKDTRKNTLSAKLLNPRGKDISLYVEQTDGVSYFADFSSDKTLSLDDVSYCEIIYRNKVRYQYGTPAEYEPQYIVLTADQFEKGSFSARQIEIETTVHTDFSGLPIEKESNDDVCVEFHSLSQVREHNSIGLEFSELYQNISFRHMDVSSESVYDVRTLDPTPPCRVSLAPSFEGYVVVGYTDKEAERSDKPQTLEFTNSELLTTINITDPDETIENKVRTIPVIAYKKNHEPVEKEVTMGDKNKESNVTFSTDEFEPSGTIVFSASEDVGRPQIRVNDYDYHTNIDVSQLTAPENVGITPNEDEHIYTDNAYLIQGVPIDTEIVIHFGRDLKLESTLRRTKVESGETVIETVDVQYRHPMIQYTNDTDTEYIISTDRGNIEARPKSSTNQAVSTDVDVFSYTVLDPESDNTVVDAGDIQIPDEPQLIPITIDPET